MRASHLLVAAAVVSASACTLIEGLPDVPAPLDGGSPDAIGARDAAPDRTTADARRDHEGPDGPTDHFVPPPLPTTLASSQANPIGLVVSSPNAFWVNNVPDGSVMRVGVGGGSKPVALAEQQPGPFSLYLAPPLVFFSREDNVIAVATVPIDGGPLTAYSGGSNTSPRWLAKDGAGHLYWTNVELGSIAEFFPVVDGGGGASSLVSGLASPSQLVADTDLFWVDNGSANVMTAALDGADAGLLADSGAGPTYLAVDAVHVYWTATTAGEVRRVPRKGGASKLIATGEGGPVGIAVDSKYVYWANVSEGKIRRAPLGGGPAVTIADKQSQPTSVAVAGGVVYWTNVGDGTVMKLAP